MRLLLASLAFAATVGFTTPEPATCDACVPTFCTASFMCHPKGCGCAIPQGEVDGTCMSFR